MVRRHTSARPWTYEKLDRLQRRIADRVRIGGPGALILSEVAPVITLGKRARAEEELRAPISELSGAGVTLYPASRGGLATYHGPGQWVLFAVDRLERLTGDPRGVRRAVEGLLGIACEVAREYDATAGIREGLETGVWTARGKVASVGVQIDRGVLLHGLSVNGFRTVTSFRGLRPCGLDFARVDYLLEREGRDFTEFGGLGEKLLEAASLRFWIDRA